jgi:ATP-binding cassette, subfamily B, bacterial HlyB/CyaB
LLRDGDFIIIGKVGDDKAVVQSPQSPRPSLMTRADLEAMWDGQLVVMTRRSGLVDLSRRFDITWFLGAIHKYRHVLGKVLVASFFLQLFALISPLFFQVVIDKVLVHGSPMSASRCRAPPSANTGTTPTAGARSSPS